MLAIRGAVWYHIKVYCNAADTPQRLERKRGAAGRSSNGEDEEALFTPNGACDGAAYARIAAEKIQQIDRQIDQTKDKSKRKEIIKKEYKALMKSFKQPLMKLSITQGRILVRLIYRETNNSAFAHIKEYKGSVNAYFWQSLALLFGNNLKADYEPYGKDREIEDIVKRIERGEL